MQGADVLAILTEWNEFRAIDLAEMRRRMSGNAIVDLRNVVSPSAARDAGFTYSGICRA